MEALPDSLKHILSSRRKQIPGDDYFKSVLPEFHRRLRSQSIRRASLREIIWERFQETFTFQMDASHGLRLAGAACAVLLAVALALHRTPENEGSSHLLTLNSPAPERSGVEYSLASAGDSSTANQFDQQLDRVSMSEGRNLQTNFTVTDVPARYVLTNHPVTYDKVAAF